MNTLLKTLNFITAVSLHDMTDTEMESSKLQIQFCLDGTSVVSVKYSVHFT